MLRAQYRLTSMVLLLNPDHQSALNARKSYLMEVSSLQDNDKVPAGASSEHLQKELDFIGFLQRNLKQVSKVSALWHHRRWVLARLHTPFTTNYHLPPEASPMDALLYHSPISTLSGTSTLPPSRSSWQDVSLPVETVMAELSLVSAACADNMYPRNYHAWTHRRVCIAFAYSAALARLDSAGCTADGGSKEGGERAVEWIQLLEGEMSDIKMEREMLNEKKKKK